MKKNSKISLRRFSMGLLVVALLPVFLIVIPVLAAYSTNIIVVTNVTYTSTDMASLYLEKDVDGLKTGGLISSTGLDTRVKSSGVDIPFMLDEDLIAFATPVDASDTADFQFSAGNTPATDYDITIGDGGTITVDDNAGLEPTIDPFEIVLDGYFDTATPIGDTDIFSKESTIEIYVEATDGTISVELDDVKELTATGVSSGEHEIKLVGTRTDDPVYYEDLDDDWVETDPDGKIATTDTRVTYTQTSPTNADYIRRDFGSGFWNGDFIYDFDFYWDDKQLGYSASKDIMLLSNTIVYDNPYDIDTNNGDFLEVEFYASTWSDGHIRISECNNGSKTGNTNTSNLSIDTMYYMRVWRDESVGTYGTLYYANYSDAARTSQIGSTTSLTLTEKQDFRYITLVGYTKVGSYWYTGYIENVNLNADQQVIELYVDDVLEDYIINPYDLTDAATDWVFDWDTIKYLDYFDYEIDSANKIHFQPDSIIYDDTLPNEDNPGTYDGDISWGNMGTISGLVDIYDEIDDDTQSKAAVTDPSYDSGTSVVDGAPEELPNMYTEGEVRWIIVAFIVAFIFGFVAYYKTRDLLVQAIVSGIVMAAFCGGGAFGSGWMPYWTVLVFGIEAFLYFVIRQKQYVG